MKFYQIKIIAFSFVVLGSLVLSGAVFAAQGDISRASLDFNGDNANSGSFEADVSADGRYVVFYSGATDLVPGDTNGSIDVFVRDMVTGVTTRVSVSSAGAEADDHSSYPAISADGRYVVFESVATNLVAGDVNGKKDIFRHDRDTGTTLLVSVSTAGAQGDESSVLTDISADGRYIAFLSYAANLVVGDGNGVGDIFIRDITLGTTTRVSVNTVGGDGNGASQYPQISGDGRYVVFGSNATNLVAGDTNSRGDIFVRDLISGTTTRVSVDSAGAEADGNSTYPSISTDGQYASFISSATNLVAGDTNGLNDVFVRDLNSGTTTRASVDSAGVQGDGNSNIPCISWDGRYVTFQSYAANLVPGDTNATRDIFVHDRTTGATSRVSVSSAGVEADSTSYGPIISADGRYVVFETGATNLVSGDGNGVFDIFRYDYLGETAGFSSATGNGGAGGGGGCFVTTLLD